MTFLKNKGLYVGKEPEMQDNGKTVSFDKDTGADLKVRAIVGNEENRERRLALIKQYYPDAIGLFEDGPETKDAYRNWAKANNISEDNFVFTRLDEDGNEIQTLYNPEGLVPDLGDIASIGRDIVSTLAYPVGAAFGVPTAAPTGGTSVLVGGALAAEGAGQAYDRLIDFLAKEYVSRGTVTKNTIDTLVRIGFDITGSGILDKVADVAKNIRVKDTVQKVLGVTTPEAKASKEVLTKAKKLGIEVPTLGQVVDSKFLQALEKRIAMKPGAVNVYAEKMKEYQNQMAKALVDLSEKYGKPVGTGEEIGFFIHKKAQDRIAQTEVELNKLYNAASEALPVNARSNLSNVKELYEDLLNQQEKTKDKARDKVITEIKSILDLSEKAVGRRGPMQQGYTAQDLLDQRSIVLRNIRAGDSPLKGDYTKSEVPFLKRLQTALFNDTEELVKNFGGEEAFDKLRKAQDYRATVQDEVYSLTNKIEQRMKQKAENVFKFAIDGTSSGSKRIKEIYDNVLDEEGKKDLTASLVRRMGLKTPDGGEGSDWTVGKFLKNYNNYSKEAKNVIFGNKELRDNLNTIVEIANRSMDVEQFANPSKTGYETSSVLMPLLSVMGATGAYSAGGSKVVAGIVGSGIYMSPRAALTLISSPKFTTWLLDTSKKADKNPNILAQSIGNLAASAVEKNVDPSYGEAVDEYINTLLFQGQTEEMSQTETKDVQTMSQAQPPIETPQQKVGNVNVTSPRINIDPTTSQPSRQMASLPSSPSVGGGITNVGNKQQFGGLFPTDNIGKLIAEKA